MSYGLARCNYCSGTMTEEEYEDGDGYCSVECYHLDENEFFGSGND